MNEFNFKSLGETIRSIRVKLEITQKELADGICSQSQISKIEKGEISPYIDTLLKIALKLGINPNYFINIIKKEQYEFITNSKNKVREYTKKKDYLEVKRLVTILEKHQAFKNLEEKQFICWHKGIYLYYLEKDSSKALEKLEEALNLKNSIQATDQDIQIMNSIGIILGEENQWEQAKMAFFHAVQIFKDSLSPMDITILVKLYYNLSKVFYKLQQSKEALEITNKGIELAIENESNYLLGELLYQKGLILADTGDISKGLDYLHQASSIFTIYKNEKYLNITQDKILLYRKDSYLQKVENIY